MANPFLPVFGGIGAANLGIGIGQTIAQNRASKDARDRNQAILDQLLAKEAGGGLGLTDLQQRELDARLRAPVAAAATGARQRAEQIQATTGGASGADLAQLRQEQTQAVGAGAQRASLAVQQAQLAAEQRDRAELEQRQSAQSQFNVDRANRFFENIVQPAVTGAGQLGLAAAAPPGTFQLTNPLGLPGVELTSEPGQGQTQGITLPKSAIRNACSSDAECEKAVRDLQAAGINVQ